MSDTWAIEDAGEQDFDNKDDQVEQSPAKKTRKVVNVETDHENDIHQGMSMVSKSAIALAVLAVAGGGVFGYSYMTKSHAQDRTQGQSLSRGAMSNLQEQSSLEQPASGQMAQAQAQQLPMQGPVTQQPYQQQTGNVSQLNSLGQPLQGSAPMTSSINQPSAMQQPYQQQTGNVSQLNSLGQPLQGSAPMTSSINQPSAMQQPYQQQGVAPTSMNTETTQQRQTPITVDPSDIAQIVAREDKTDSAVSALTVRVGKLELGNGKGVAMSHKRGYVEGHRVVKKHSHAKRVVSEEIYLEKPSSKINVVQAPEVIVPAKPVIPVSKCKYLGGLDQRGWVSCNGVISSIQIGDTVDGSTAKNVDTRNGVVTLEDGATIN